MGAPSQLAPGSSSSPAPPRAAPDGAQPIGWSANPTTEEMRQYHAEGRYLMPIRVGSTWLFGSGN